jgi:hypothetical protein
MKVKKRLLLLVFMLSSITVLSLPQEQDLPQGGFCRNCETRCYNEAENVDDYNACVTLCNLAGCDIPIIR